MTRLEETAENFAACRQLAAFCRQHNIPRQNFHRRAQYWWRAFAFAYVDHCGRDLFVDEVNCGLFIMVGSGTP